MKPFTTRGPIWTTAWMITSMAAMVAILCLLGATQTYARKMATRDDHRAGFSGVVRADIHNTIAAYYRKDAKRLDAGAENFAALAEVHRESRGAYRYGPFATGLEPGVCTILAEHRAKMAAKARDLAGNHEELAQLLSDQSPSVSSHRKAGRNGWRRQFRSESQPTSCVTASPVVGGHHRSVTLCMQALPHSNVLQSRSNRAHANTLSVNSCCLYRSLVLTWAMFAGQSRSRKTLLHGSSRRMSYHWFFNAGGSPNAT